MRVSKVDLLAGTLREEGSTTKSGQGNEIKMTPDLRTLLQACVVGKKPDDYLSPAFKSARAERIQFKSTGSTALLISDRLGNVRRRQRENLIFTSMACADSLHGGLIVPGVGQKTAMAVKGRKTDSIYRRYNVVDHRDRDLAVDRLVEYQHALAKASQITTGQKRQRNG